MLSTGQCTYHAFLVVTGPSINTQKSEEGSTVKNQNNNGHRTHANDKVLLDTKMMEPFYSCSFKHILSSAEVGGYFLLLLLKLVLGVIVLMYKVLRGFVGEIHSAG